MVPRQANKSALRAIPVILDNRVPAVIIAVDRPKLLGVFWLTGLGGMGLLSEVVPVGGFGFTRLDLGWRMGVGFVTRWFQVGACE